MQSFLDEVSKAKQSVSMDSSSKSSIKNKLVAFMQAPAVEQEAMLAEFTKTHAVAQDPATIAEVKAVAKSEKVLEN